MKLLLYSTQCNAVRIPEGSRPLGLWIGVVAAFLVLLGNQVLGQTITGTVFRDFNSDGIYTSIPASGTYAYGEPGVGGITIKAYNTSGVVVATTTSSTATATFGSYTLTVNNTNAYRVEFTNLSSSDYEAFSGTGNKTAIQFVNGGATGVDLGINYPADYCQSVSPQLVTNCFIGVNAATANASAKALPAMIGVPYTGVDGSATITDYSTIGEVGAVWGITYKNDSKQLFSAAFTKRHVGFSTGGPNAIYITNVTSATSGNTTEFFNFTTVGGTAVTSTTEAHGTDLPTSSASVASHDSPAFDAVGKTSLGGMDISDDNKTLYVINLKDQKLYSIDIATKVATGVLIPNPGCTTSSTVVNGSYRPFAVKFYKGKIYIGVVCTREDLGASVVPYGATNGLSATVYAVNPATPASFTTVLSFPLTYQKSPTNADLTGQSRAEYWRPWTSIFQGDRTGPYSFPQAWLTDIDFEPGTGDMIVGLRDRYGDQIGYQNYKPFTTATDLISAITPGEILRARKCSPTDVAWTLESNGALCGTVTSASATQSTIAGPGSGKYYWGDRVQNGANHGLSSQAGLSQLAGSAKIAMTAVDPLDVFNTGGIKRLINATGAKDGNATGTAANPGAGVELYSSDALGFGKANGLGGLELLCNPAPIQIGNRVWLDANDNGVQDAGEIPLAGVKVTLTGPGITGSVSVTTNAQGEYYFSSGTGTPASGYVYSLTGLVSGGAYALSFPTSITTNNAILSSKPNSATGSNAEAIDSDATAGGIISFTLGSAGQNNFSYDAAFVPCTPPSLTATASNNTLCAGEAVNLIALVSPAGSYTYSWSAPASVTLTGATTATATTTGLPSGVNTFTVTVSNSPVCSTSATVSVMVNATPIATLSATQTSICIGQSTTLTASGGNTYRFSTTGTTSATATAVVSPTATTTYSVTAINASGCSSTATISITVNPLPVASLNSLTLNCASPSGTLSASVSGGITPYTYLWSTGASSASITATTAGPYSVTVAGANGCKGVVMTTVLSDTAAPTLTLSPSSTLITAGESVTLTAACSAGGMINWSTSPADHGLTSLVMSPTATTTYSVTCVTPAGCATTVSTTIVVQATATLGDFVFEDKNGNGQQDPGEPGINGVLVTLLGGASPVSVTTIDGLYSFSGLTPGVSYTVVFTTPQGYVATVANQGNDASDSDSDPITGRTMAYILAPGETNNSIDAGFYRLASLGDKVFVDTNRDGLQSLGENGIPNVQISLISNGSVVATTLSQPDGIYSFTGLTPGIPYSVSFVSPTNYSSTSAHIGNNDSLDSDVDPGTGQTQSVTLASGENNVNLDAGYFLLKPNLTITKSVDKSRAQVGDILSYTLVLSNSGNGAATNVVVQDSSTVGLTYVTNSVTAPLGTTFTPGSPISTWAVSSVSPGQSFTLTFQARVDSAGILYNQATIPGDTALVCTSVPVRVCAGSGYEFTLTVPAGHNRYQWFKDGVEIMGQTSNTLLVTSPGAYSLVIDNMSGKCTNFSCCPFIVEEDSLPTFKAGISPVSCIGNTLQQNGTIVLSNFNPAYTYQYSAGTSFNPAASLSGAAKIIPANGVIVSNLANPASTQAYTVRVYNQSGCYTDQTVLLIPTVCNCPAEVCVPVVLQQTKRPKRIGDSK